MKFLQNKCQNHDLVRPETLKILISELQNHENRLQNHEIQGKRGSESSNIMKIYENRLQNHENRASEGQNGVQNHQKWSLNTVISGKKRVLKMDFVP